MSKHRQSRQADLSWVLNDDWLEGEALLLLLPCMKTVNEIRFTVASNWDPFLVLTDPTRLVLNRKNPVDPVSIMKV